MVNVDALKRFMTGTCSVYVKKGYKNKETGRTDQEDRAVFTALPCRLSYRTKAPVSDVLPGISQEARLFLLPRVDVPEGSRIEVTQNSVTDWYCQSGPAAVYASHLEIPVVLERRWA